jgi:glutamate-5-semialdehyde dehydrogenase
VIARGGEELKRTIVAESRIPVVKHFEGICHLYVDATADLDMAERLCLDAKVRRPSVCNAIETLLVHEGVAAAFLPRIVRALGAHGCEVRGCPATRRIVPDVAAATDADWDTEYLDLVLSVAVVPSLEAAIAFIAAHGTGLAEAIVTESYAAAERFLGEVDSAAVFVNASTRFTDGGEFGFGAEVGISTNRLHARGPMGLRELTTYKYRVRGNGQTRG